VEEGSHQSLIARGGVFAKLHRAQHSAGSIHAASAA
jgi:ABC-type multidrug transport system fused ATPase/permease subunit